MAHESNASDVTSPPRFGKADIISGFLVFLIALPLCLGISMASGCPPFAGVITAIVGGLLVSLFMGAPLTIKGPAAGLIVIVLGAVEELGRGDATIGYRRMLAVVVISGAVQALFGVLRAGKLGDFFPASAVHGMLAAIGVIIVGKQIHVALGVAPAAKDPVGLLLEIPKSVAHANPAIAAIGLSSLAILVIWPLLRAKWTKSIPAPLLVLAAAIPLGAVLDLGHPHAYVVAHRSFDLTPKFLVAVPDHFAQLFVFPDFSEATSAVSLKFVVLFSLIGSLESLLSAKAIDTLDPWGRKSALDRDLVAVGVGNALSGLVGGLPMISEIVRSSANIQNGGRTRWANFFHGLSLLAFVALAPGLVHRIPLAALAAMLVYTGLRLASPKEFAKTYKIGAEQLAIFVTTIVATLATDLLIGIAAGIALQAVLHLVHGVGVGDLFKPAMSITEEGGVVHARVERAATFGNWLGIKAKLASVPHDKPLILDLSGTVLVDHTVMEHLLHEQVERRRAGGSLELRGLDAHKPVSAHPQATHVRVAEAVFDAAE